MKHSLALLLSTLLFTACATGYTGQDAARPTRSRAAEAQPSNGAPPATGFFFEDSEASGLDVGLHSFGLVGKELIATATQEQEVPEPEAAGSDRQLIYSALLRLVVVSTDETLGAIQALAERVGGYLQESDSRSITVRVPAVQFDAVVGEVAGMGELVDRQVRTQDVTEELFDLEIRLENARQARARLLEHLERSEDIEATLKIEAELTRVTEEIERMEGRQRFLQSRVAMSTIRVELNTVQPQGGRSTLNLPFGWIEELGDGLMTGTAESMPRKPRIFSRGPRFEPPAGFVRYFSEDELVEAMSADGVRVKVREHTNYDEGDLSFWAQLSRRALVEGRALAVGEQRGLGDDQHLIQGSRSVGESEYGYVLVLTRTRSKVFTFEAWGEAAVVATHRAALIESARSLRR